MLEQVEPVVLAAMATGLLLILGQALVAWYGRRKTTAEARKAAAEAEKADAETRRAEAETTRIAAEELAEVWAMVDQLTGRVKAIELERTQVEARAHALRLEVDELKKQQGISIATIAALNSQNAATLKMNNELLLENRLLHQRVEQLENELSTERQASAIAQQKIKALEARITELEARMPSM